MRRISFPGSGTIIVCRIQKYSKQEIMVRLFPLGKAGRALTLHVILRFRIREVYTYLKVIFLGHMRKM
jgi:hypothetical protein